MLRRRRLSEERRVTRSPLWIRLLDEFADRPVTTGLEVTLERLDDGRWVEAVERPTITSSGDIAFVGLGRAREPELVGNRSYRVRVDVAGYRPDYPPPGGGLIAVVAAWNPERPPTSEVLLRVLPLLPATSYPFAPRTPLLNGSVRDTAGRPVSDAEVSASLTVNGINRRERVLSDERGAFRLPLRWAAGATRIDAAKGTLTGAVTVTVPADLSATHVITLA
jgi:hypothetical protein